MTEKKWQPKKPIYPPPRCVICGVQIYGGPFHASKPRHGATIYCHVKCYEAEQAERTEEQCQKR